MHIYFSKKCSTKGLWWKSLLICYIYCPVLVSPYSSFSHEKSVCKRPCVVFQESTRTAALQRHTATRKVQLWAKHTETLRGITQRLTIQLKLRCSLINNNMQSNTVYTKMLIMHTVQHHDKAVRKFTFYRSSYCSYSNITQQVKRSPLVFRPYSQFRGF